MNNTTKIGDYFEDKVYKLFKNELEQDRLFIKGENSKIYQKKGYYSRDRKKDIIFDITIEVFIPGETEYSLLIIIECKNYSHSVPVDDVEEFFSKLQQISGANVKGIVISPNSFQNGALEFSKSKGIGIARFIDNDNFKWILRRAVSGIVTQKEIQNSEYNILEALSNENFVSTHIDFFGYVNDNYTYSTKYLFEYLLEGELDKIGVDKSKFLVQNKGNTPFVQFIPKRDIEEESKKILKSIEYVSGEVSIDKIIEYLDKRENIKLQFSDSLDYDNLGFEVLGFISFETSTITISKIGNHNEHRMKFTIAHELGHILLDHSNYLNKEYYAENDIEDGGYDIINVKEIRKLEWQANYFASSLILPKDPFLNEFFKLLEMEDIRNKGYGALYVDSQQCNINHYYIVTNRLREKFSVSRKAISIRLKNLGFLNDATGMYA
jgi:Zn-dependent peptidase ImmA (M78 family)